MEIEEHQEFIQRKERNKRIRTFVQIIILVLVLVIAITTLYTVKDYVPYQEQTGISMSSDKGFIALSYFGVSRVGDQILIGRERLSEHLSALKKLGYVTITQRDIEAYYKEGKELPDKALFLMFEDGRRDTAIFSQKILEELNFKATAFTYPEKFVLHDSKFLMPDELKDLLKTSYWEWGTNGYRLAFINVFDRYNNYIGELDPVMYAMISPYLGRRYNHYLMDYIRDQGGMPRESYLQMKNRIGFDYEKLQDIYTKELGTVPSVYSIMHANTGCFGNNGNVSAVNEWWIKNLFTMNFNREGFCLNKRNSSIYDLTRMQPQAYWHTNHLLMRMKYDINEDIDFVKGDLEKYEQWNLRKGAAEFKNQKIILTSLPRDEGLLYLNGSDKYQNLRLNVSLLGNKLGLQKIYLRSDKNLNRYIAVSINNNILMVDEKENGKERNIFWLNLEKLDIKKSISIAEDEKAAKVRTLEAFTRYADTVEKAKVYGNRLQVQENEVVQSVEEGAERYNPLIPIAAKEDRDLTVTLQGGNVTIEIDKKTVVSNLAINVKESGGICLSSAWGGYGWSQRNLVDDVYDGVFDGLMITYPSQEGKEQILFDSHLKGCEGMYYQLEKQWNRLIDWFIKYL